MKFLGLFLAAAAALAIAYAALARVIDPRGTFGGGSFPVVELDARAEKMRLFEAYARQGAPGALILGSSRAMKLAPRALERLSGQRAFNFAVDNARAEDYLAIYRWVRAQGVRPTLLVVGLDVEALHDDDRAEASLLDERALVVTLGAAAPAQHGLLAPFGDLATVRLLKRHKAAFTVEYLADMARAVRFSVFPSSRSQPLMEFEPDGYLRYRRWEQQRAAGAFRLEQGFERCLARALQRFESMTGLSSRRRAYLRLLADEARADGVRVVVWITTLHPLTEHELETRTRYPALLAATRDYLRGLAHDGVAGHDFSRPDSYRGSPTDFYDCLHIDEHNAERVMAALGPELR